MISVKSKNFNFDVLGSFIIAGVDEADKLRGLFEHELDLIHALKPWSWKALVNTMPYPDSE